MFKVMAQASVTQAGPQCWLYWEIGFDFRLTIECFVIILCEMVHDLSKLCVACRLTERVLEDDCVYAMCEAVKVLELVVCWPAVTWGEEDLGGAGPREWQGRGECLLKVAMNRKVLKVRGGLGDGSVIQVTWSGCLEWGGLEEWWVEIWWSMSSKQTIKVWLFAILTSGHGTYIKMTTDVFFCDNFWCARKRTHDSVPDKACLASTLLCTVYRDSFPIVHPSAARPADRAINTQCIQGLQG